MIPATTERVILNTPPKVNDAIRDQMRESVLRYASGTPQSLDRRLRELDHEWDIDRIAATGAGLGLIVGVFLASMIGSGWLIVPYLIAVSLLLHALVGWSPALPIMRRMGFRTEREIDHERYALKALRGDFQVLALHTTPQDREDHARFEDEGGPPAPEPAVHPADPEVVDEALRASKS